MADTFTPPPLSAHEGPAQGFVPPPPVEDKPSIPQRIQQFGQQHPYISGAASLLIPGASGALDPTQEVGKGALKQVGRDAYNVATSPALGPLGMGAGYLSKKSGLEDRVMKATEPTNERQQVGGYGTTAAEMAIPMPKALSAASDILPSTERAGQNFRTVARAANNIPLDLTKASGPALEAHELGETGSTVPKVMSKFLKRATSPDEPPLTYETGRRFATNAGRLSTKESLAVNPPMKAQVSEFAKAISDANREAATKVGMGDVYDSAVNEYRRAKTLGNMGDKAVQIAKKYILPAAAAGAAGGIGYKTVKALGD